MTNSNDFRRYSYTADASYVLKAFEAQRSNAAPAYEPKRKRDFKIHENTKKKSYAQLVAEQKLGFRQILIIISVSLVCISMMVAVLYSYAQKNELNHEISALESKIETTQSENTRLTSALDSMVSMSVLDQYAVEELGMTKVRANRICYINVAQYKEQREKTLKEQNTDTDNEALE